MGSSNTIKVVAGVLVLLAFVLAVIAFKIYRNLAENSQAQSIQTPVAQQASQSLAVVATKPLLANEPISKDSIALVPVPVAPKDYFANVDDVVGRLPLIDVDAGSPLTPRFFKESNQLTRLIPAGTRAIALELNDVLGVGNFVKPGDIVDVLLYLKVDQLNAILPAQARTLLKDALVLAYDERITSTPQQQDPKRDDGSQQNRAQASAGKHQRTIILAVPEADITNVMLGAGLGELRLALHGAATQDAGSLPVVAASALPAPGQSVADVSAKASDAISASEFWDVNAEYQKTTGARGGGQIAKRKPEASHAAGIQIYRGTKRETVYP